VGIGAASETGSKKTGKRGMRLPVFLWLGQDGPDQAFLRRETKTAMEPLNISSHVEGSGTSK